jgi:hypothetical protein
MKKNPYNHCNFYACTRINRRTDDRCQKSDDRCQMSEDRCQMSEDRGQIAEFGNFQTIRRWTFDAYSPPPEDSTFISFSFDLTGRSRPAAALNTDPPAVENHQLRITCCQKKSLSAYPIGTTRFKFESIAQENGGKLSKL